MSAEEHITALDHVIRQVHADAIRENNEIWRSKVTRWLILLTNGKTDMLAAELKEEMNKDG